ncbi:MAG: hypothetical protein SFV15_14825 [Polyangiaceae bacterium]|nr:hypothetical protein [Polyangiaceae bacterium]
MPSTLLTRVPPGTFGPYWARMNGGGLSVWAIANEAGYTELFALPLTAAFEKQGEPKLFGKIEGDLERLALKVVHWEGREEPGFAVVTSSRLKGEAGKERHRIQLVALDSAGERLREPATLDENVERIYWVEVLDVGGGPLLFWASARGKTADIIAVKLKPTGESSGPPQSIARDVRSWQVVPFGQGAALGMVQGQVGVKTRGSVQVLRLTGTGAKVGIPTVLAKAPTANLDLDLAPLANNLLVSWSDIESGEGRIKWSVMNQEGVVLHEPQPLGAPTGEQSLLKLVPSFNRDRAYAIWEEKSPSPNSVREVRVRSLHDDGSLSEPSVTVETAQSERWELEASASSTGLALLVPGRLCSNEGKCERSDVPTLVQLAEDLSVTSSGPLALEALGGAYLPLAWNLSCAPPGCTVLGATAGQLSPVYSVAIKAQATPFRSIAHRIDPEPRPRVAANTVVGDVAAPLADVDWVLGPSGPLLAQLTYFDPEIPYEKPKAPAPDGKLEPVRAELSIKPLSGAPLGSFGKASPTGLPQQGVVSYRAHSAAGVALASGPSRESLLVWSALDAGKPQVFVTLLDERGMRVKQRMLTRLSEAPSDVAAIHTDSGWVVGWVDNRDGDREVYVTKINYKLVNMAPEVRVSHTPGQATSLHFQNTADGLLVAWSDGANEKAGPDIYSTVLDTSKLSVRRNEARVFESVGASILPQLAVFGGDTELAWIEQSSSEVPSAQIRFGKLLPDGSLQKNGVPVVLPVGKVHGFALDCGRTCRAVALLKTDDHTGVLVAVDGLGAATTTKQLLQLSGPVQTQASLLLAGDRLVYAEGMGTDKSRVRDLTIEW